MMAMMPPMRASNIPMQVRAMLALMVAASLTPMTLDRSTDLPASLPLIVIAMSKELLLGLLFGSAALLILSGLQVGGQIVSQLAGLDMATAADPSVDEEVAVVGQLFSWMTMALFLALGGHRVFFSTCIESFQTYRAGAVLAEERWLLHLPGLVQYGFSVGIRAMAPLGLAVFLANLVTALIGRTLPQLNVLAVGFNINALVLLSVLVLSIGSVGWIFQNELAAWLQQTSELFPSTSLEPPIDRTGQSTLRNAISHG